MTVLFIYATFILLVVVLLIVMLYFIKEGIKKREISKKVGRKYKVIKKVFDEQVNSKKDLLFEDIEKIKSLLDKYGLEAFEQCFSEYVNKNGEDNKIRNYIDRVFSYDLLARNKFVKKKYSGVYLLYLISFYGLTDKDSISYAFSMIEDKSSYVRSNAFKVLSRSKDENLLCDALLKSCNLEKYLNNKFIIDILEMFNGDKTKLHKILISSFKGFNSYYKKSFIEYFTNNKVQDEEVVKTLLKILSNDKDIELEIATIKYFGMVKNEEAGKIIASKLSSHSWEVCAISAKVIKNYPSKSVVSKLVQLLGNANWFVRENSASTLYDIKEGFITDAEILNTKDNFAKDIYEYTIKEKGNKKKESIKKGVRV